MSEKPPRLDVLLAWLREARRYLLDNQPTRAFLKIDEVLKELERGNK